MSLQVTDPTNYPGWDEVLECSPGATFFHSSAWADTLKKTYGFHPHYFVVFDNGKLSALVAVMEVNSFLTGKRGVSLPFTDFCEPLLDGGLPFEDVFEGVLAIGKKRGWQYMELRGGERFLARSVSASDGDSRFREKPRASSRYLLHSVDLTGAEGEVLNRLRDSTRRNIRKAQRLKVEVKFLNTAEAMDDFYRLNILTRKRHGLPPQPRAFFTNFYREVISKGKGIVALAYQRERPVAANIFCFWGREAIFKYGASDRAVQGLRANNLLMWRSMRWLREHGYENLSLGRTEVENQGLRQFKLGWGAREATISYYCYDLKESSFVERSRDVAPWQRWIFSKFPSPLLNLMGRVLYSHAA